MKPRKQSSRVIVSRPARIKPRNEKTVPKPLDTSLCRKWETPHTPPSHVKSIDIPSKEPHVICADSSPLQTLESSQIEEIDLVADWGDM